MPNKITPFLWFDTQAEEAMNFYVSIFKNSKVLSVSRRDDEKRHKYDEHRVFHLPGRRMLSLISGANA